MLSNIANYTSSDLGITIITFLLIISMIMFPIWLLAIDKEDKVKRQQEAQTKAKNKENKKIREEKENNMNRCQICGEPCGIYEICRQCAQDIQDGKVLRCNHCNKYYLKESICSCMKEKSEETREEPQSTKIENNINISEKDDEGAFSKGVKGSLGTGCGCLIIIIIVVVIIALLIQSSISHT